MRERPPKAGIAREKNFLCNHVLFIIEKRMSEKDVSRSELARRMGVSRPHITQILRPGSNMTLNTVAEILYHLGMRLDVSGSEM